MLNAGERLERVRIGRFVMVLRARRAHAVAKNRLEAAQIKMGEAERSLAAVDGRLRARKEAAVKTATSCVLLRQKEVKALDLWCKSERRRLESDIYSKRSRRAFPPS